MSGYPSPRLLVLFAAITIATLQSARAVPLTKFGGPEGDVARGSNITLGGISRDGSTVFGALDTGGFYWNASLGSTVQPLPGEVKFSSLRGDVLAGDNFVWSKRNGATTVPFTIKSLSADGSTLIGQDTTGGVRWSSGVGVQRLDFTPTGLSGSGSVIVGTKAGSVVRWTQTGQTSFQLPRPAYCDDPTFPMCGPGEIVARSVQVSRDGKRIVGTGEPPAIQSIPFNDFVFWTSSSAPGSDLSTLDLHSLSVLSPDGKTAFAFNCCLGSSVVHTSHIDLDDSSRSYGDLGGYIDAVDTSFDGSAMLFVVPGSYDRFGYWDPTLTDFSLLSYLKAKGVDEIDVEPFYTAGVGTRALISDDGRTFAGDLTPWPQPPECPPGECRPLPKFWVVTLPIPEPSVLIWLSVLLPMLFAAARHRDRS